MKAMIGGPDRQDNPSRREILMGAKKLAAGAAAAAALGATEAEANDKKLDAMTGAERLNLLENEATQLLDAIKKLKESGQKPAEEERAMPNMNVLQDIAGIQKHTRRIGEIGRYLDK